MWFYYLHLQRCARFLRAQGLKVKIHRWLLVVEGSYANLTDMYRRATAQRNRMERASRKTQTKKDIPLPWRLPYGVT